MNWASARVATDNWSRPTLEQAVSFGRACLGICQEIGDSSTTSARCIEIGAAVLRGLGKTTTAVVLISAAATRRTALGAPVSAK
jgi:hypothetical protein